MLEENEELNLGGNDTDKVIAMSRGITGCDDCDESSVTECYRFAKNYNNRAHSSDEVSSQNVLNEKWNNQDETNDSSNEVSWYLFSIFEQADLYIIATIIEDFL